MSDAVSEIIWKLQNHELRSIDVPKEFENNMEIIRTERKLGLRIISINYYDILQHTFLVVEKILYDIVEGEFLSSLNYSPADKKAYKKDIHHFQTIEEVYNYLGDSIYINSCYIYYDFDKEKDFITMNRIDLEKLKERQAYTNRTVDDFFSTDFSVDFCKFNEGEKVKVKCLKWLKKFTSCLTYDDFSCMASNYMKSSLSKSAGIDFFLENLASKKEFSSKIDLIVEYVFSRKYFILNKNKRNENAYFSFSFAPLNLLYLLCSIYGVDYINNIYSDLLHNGKIDSEIESWRNKYISSFENNCSAFCSHSFFDSTTHFYCDEVKVSASESYKRWFETFDEFVIYKKYDLRGCDISNALDLKFDFSSCIVNEKTKLPPRSGDDLKYSISKKYKQKSFYVNQTLRDARGALIRESIFSSEYFADFVWYLKGDLSNSNLLHCEGLENLPRDCGIDFTNAIIRSCVCEKMGLKYETYPLNEAFTQKFELPSKNEEQPVGRNAEHAFSISIDNNLLHLSDEERWHPNGQRVFYITDIHLIHRLKNAGCKSKADIIYAIQRIVSDIVSETGELLLIGGDVAADLQIFTYFVDILKFKIESIRHHTIKVVFVLGNHELWSFKDQDIDEIKSIYKSIIESRGMILLQNDLLYKDSAGNFHVISYDELHDSSEKHICEKLRNSRLVILGGIGFSGYNKDFNANSGIYCNALNRSKEIEETAIFEMLYQKLLPLLQKKNVVILTHMPLKDWCEGNEYCKGFVYVSGHTHKSVFYDDGCYRIYSDNQIGYGSNQVHLKSFLMDTAYDYFDDYKDGIYEISREQYLDYFRGRNLPLTFTKEFSHLYMLKRLGYYCFIKQNHNNKLSIMNGGRAKALSKKDIRYYYEHMNEMIQRIKNPLDKFTTIQQKISDEIVKIGGTGNIHGCIIDIDFYNHIYVNPDDVKITGYYALDMVYKTAYCDIPSLLKVECPALYSNYLKLIEGNEKSNFLIAKRNETSLKISEPYYSTDIYRKSNEIYKMQKLKSNLLCAWYEGEHDISMLPEKASK